MITYSQIGHVGRLGNCLFEIAGTIGIAIKSGQQYAFPKLIIHDMIERFGSKEDPEVWKYLINPLPELEDAGRYNFQTQPYFWEYRDIKLTEGNWDLTSHFQSVKYFEHCIYLIRHYFTFKDEPEQNDYVAIHYRAGDYIDDPEAYHPRCSKEYYQQAMNSFPNGTKFMIFSDNVIEAAKSIGTYSEFYPLPRSSENYIEDFKLMKKCKSFICANSSFSHMAALLGNHPEKKIIMPKKWFGAQANGLNFDSLYPPQAIIL